MAVMDGERICNATLCWECAKACGGCDWSRENNPVPGWNAVSVKISISHNNYVDSFIVKNCPEYNGDGRIRKEDVNVQGVYAMMEACMKLAGKDYIKGGPHAHREVSRFFRDVAPSKHYWIMKRLKLLAEEYEDRVREKNCFGSM